MHPKQIKILVYIKTASLIIWRYALAIGQKKGYTAKQTNLKLDLYATE